MKKLNIKILILTFIFSSILNIQSLIANNHPPIPRDGGGLDGGVVVGGTAPIDDYIPLLFTVALIFGAWIINYKKEQLTLKDNY